MTAWKPISEAPKHKRVLVFGPLTDGGTYMEVSKWWFSERHVDGGCFPVVWMKGYGAPTRWQPLPAPPEGEGAP
jgi:hypothetical protein